MHIEELQFAINELQTIVVVTDLKGRIRYANSAFETKYGYKLDEVMGQNPRILKTNYHNKAFYKEMWQTILSGETWEGIFLNKTQSGRLVWEEAKISPIKKDGKVEGFIAIKEDVTYKKELEEQFRKEKFLLDELFDNAPVGVILFQPVFSDDKIINLTVIKANAVAAEIFNRTELLGFTVAEFLPDFPKSSIKDKEMLISKQQFELYFASLNKHLNMRTFPVENEQFCMYVHDVTPYKNSITALQKSEQRYSSLVEDSPALIRRFNKQGVISYVNSYYAQYFKKTPNQFVGANLLNLLPDNQKEPFIRNLNSLTIENPIVEYQQKVTLPDGSIRWQKWVDRMLIDSDGNTQDFQSVGMDFTQLKQAEEALEEQNNRLDAIFDNDIMGIAVMDNEGFFTLANARHKEMFDFEDGVKLTNYNYFDSINEEDLDLVKENFKKLFSGTYGNMNLQRAFVTKKGKIFWAEIFVSPISKVNGRYTELVGLIIDITEKRKMELELKDSEQKLKKLNNTKDKLFSIIAHDIKNPFNAILGFSTLLSKNLDDFSGEEIKEFTQRILEASEQTYKLLEDLLTWAKSQLGQLHARKTIFDAKEIIDECIDYLHTIAQAKEVKLINKIIEPALAKADLEMFKFIIRNLMHNAIKFSQANSNVECGVMPSTNTNKITFYVKDFGVGIHPDKLKVLFNLDEFLSTAGTSQEKGTGLGLSLAKEMVELNAGNVQVISNVNVGTEFRITFLTK